jgi:hypothetical protein
MRGMRWLRGPKGARNKEDLFEEDAATATHLPQLPHQFALCAAKAKAAMLSVKNALTELSPPTPAPVEEAVQVPQAVAGRFTLDLPALIRARGGTLKERQSTSRLP